MSGGRLERGIGTGWNEQESGAYGIELGPPGARSDRFEGACAVLTGLLSPQQTTTSRGRYCELTGARCDPKPVQQPHPPICIGGHGEKRTLRTAARFAQHWNFGGGTPGQFVSLPPPHTPAVLEPLASALAELPTAALSRPGRHAT